MKNESENKFDDLELFFKSNLEDNEEKPPELVWRNIESELDQGKNRRPLFFWWFSLSSIIAGLLIGGYFLYPKLMGNDKAMAKTETRVKTNSANNETADAKTETEKNKDENNNQQISNTAPASETKEGMATNESKNHEIKNEIKQTTSTRDVNKSAEKANESTAKKIINNSINVIQIGSFKNKPNLEHYKNIPYKIVSKPGDNGLTRYYVVVDGDINDVNEELKKYGIKQSYIPEQAVDISTAELVLNRSENISKKENSIAVNANTESVTGEIKTTNKPTAIVKRSLPIEDNTKGSSEITMTKNTNEKNSKENESPTKTQTEKPKAEIALNNLPTTTPTNTNVLNESVANINAAKTATEIPQPEKTIEVAKIDSLPKAIAKTDSLPKPVTKIDTAKTTTAKKPEDVSPQKFIPQLAFIFDGGPNIPLSFAQSASSNVASEKYPMTYNGNFKFQITPIKILCISAGVGYSNYSMSKPQATFYFDKFLSTDYTFTTTAGNFVVDKNTMVAGFFTIAPVPSFRADYQYNSTIYAINIPVETQVNFINGKNFKIWISAGLNTNYIISQKTHLDLIKENETIPFNYSTVQTNRFNYLLLFGLGCDIRIKKNLFFTAAPLYKRSLSNLSTAGDIVYKPEYFSAQAGLKYVFKH